MSAKEEFEKLPAWLQELWTLNPRLAREAEKALSSHDSTPTEGIGKRVVEEWNDENGGMNNSETRSNLAQRIDRALAAPRMTLDLSSVYDAFEPRVHIVVQGGLDLAIVAIRDQLPDVKVVME